MAGRLPLSGIRIADFGWVWAGTLLGSILGSYGAEVIKIESKRRLDGMRLGRVFELGDELEKNPSFHNLNRNKLSITVDISKEEGAQLIKELVKKSDIVIENFTPGTLQKRGLDYSSLARIKPDLIMISLSPMGQRGPLADLVTYAPIISALSGIDSMVGYPGESPLGFKHAYADVVASMSGLFALLVAIRHRARTGEGQYIDLSQGESVMPAMGEAFMEYDMNHRVMGPQGNTSKAMAPHGIYRCAGDDKWVSIAVKTDAEWDNFCDAIGNPPWTKDDRFSTTAKRIAHARELDGYVTEWTSRHGDYEATEILQRAGVAAAPVLTTEGIFLDPHFNERQVFVNVEHPVLGNTVLYNWPWKIFGLEHRMQRCPLLGEHNDYVFGDILGLTRDDIKALTEKEIIY